jgi:hypothetical protein
MDYKSANKDLKNLRPLLAYISTFKSYPPTRATVNSIYSKLHVEDEDGDDSAKAKEDGDDIAKAKEFFECLGQDFDGFISNDHGIPFQPNYADSFGDWHVRLISEYNSDTKIVPLMECMAKRNLLIKRRGDKTKN